MWRCAPQPVREKTVRSVRCSIIGAVKRATRALEQDSSGKERPGAWSFLGEMAGATGLEPATYGVTGRHSNQLSYAPAGALRR